ncbi:MAG: Trk system potassium transporter TrkA [Eubacterium sp.]|nr:Trk system potassium transporter TrkA [Candidatus Colimonas fimequi]
MKILIVGAGKLGVKVASALLGGDHDVTIMDIDEALLKRVGSQIDVMTVNANAKETKALMNINIASYDFLIATTGSDEQNIVIASFAKKLGCSKVIARVRDPEHMSQFDFIKDTMNIDSIVNPDLGITQEIYKYIVEKYTLGNGIFTMGGASLIEYKVFKHPDLINKHVSEVGPYLPNMLVIAVSRNGKIIIPNGDTLIEENDSVYVIGEKEPIEELNAKVHERGKYTNLQKVMIVGGGKTGFFLAQKLSAFGVSVKIVEKSKERCHYLSTHLKNVMVLNGDATDFGLLEEENIDQMGAVVTATGFDEDNLLLALNAKRHNVKYVIAKVSRAGYAEIITDMGIDMALNPLDITTSAIIRFIQGYKKVLTSQLIQGQAEIMEIVATPRMKILNKPLKELGLPSGMLIAAIHRGNQVIIPNGNTKIIEDDRVTLISLLSDLDVTEGLINDTGRKKFNLFRRK